MRAVGALRLLQRHDLQGKPAAGAQGAAFLLVVVVAAAAASVFMWKGHVLLSPF